MTDVPDSESIVIPAELMGKIPLPLGLPSSYRVVSSAVEQFNQATGSDFDPISVAEALVQKGYMINFIPERKVEIQPTDEGLILDSKQILQILGNDRLAEFPILARAIHVVQYLAIMADGHLRGMEHMGQSLLRSIFAVGYRGNDDPRAAAEEVLLDKVKSDLRFGERAVSAEEAEKLAPRIVEQAKFLIENMQHADQLHTKEEKRQREHRHEIAKEQDRKVRQNRREELFDSAEAAERWLFGVARGAYRDAKDSVEDAAQELAKSKRAPELIAHHAIDLFDFTDRQIARAVERERDRRKEIAWIEGPIAVLLAAFAKPRVINDSQSMVRKNPGDHMYRLVTLWLDAKFVTELPDGAYIEALHFERQYQEKQRKRSSGEWRRDPFFRYERADDSFFDGIADAEKNRGDQEIRGYESSRIATLWWKCPQWLQWKILRPHIGDELRKVADIVRGYNAKQFLAHVDSLVTEQKRLITRFSTGLGTTKAPEPSELDALWKEVMESGAFDSIMRLGEKLGGSPAQQRAEAMIQACRERIRNLEEMRDYVNLDFVMSREQRDAEIECRQRERARWQLSSLFGRFR